MFIKHTINITYILELPEWHKLDNVSDSWFSWWGSKNSIVTIKKLHSIKVCSSNTNNDNGHGQFRGINYGSSSLIKVCYYTIRYDQKYKVLLSNQ